MAKKPARKSSKATPKKAVKRTTRSAGSKPKASATNAKPAIRSTAASMTLMHGKIRYGVHPAVLMAMKWVEEMKEKTGRTLEEWIVYIIEKGPTDEPARRTWLKDTHGLGTNTAWWLAERSFGRNMWDHVPEKYLEMGPAAVDKLYLGGRAALRPLHDKLATLGCSLGKDAHICPCETMMPLYREHVFARIMPTTLTRIDLGFALADLLKQGKAKFPARLIDTGGFAKKDRITHRIEIKSIADIDAEVAEWLRTAYELDGKEPR